MTRFFLAGPRRVGETVALDAGDARKATLVLRLRDGDAVEAIDGAGTSYLATLARAPDGGAAVRLIALAPVAQAPEREIVLAQGIPKGAKMDYVIEKATELGGPSRPRTARRNSVVGVASPERRRSNAAARRFPQSTSRARSPSCSRSRGRPASGCSFHGRSLSRARCATGFRRFSRVARASCWRSVRKAASRTRRRRRRKRRARRSSRSGAGSSERRPPPSSSSP